MNITDRQPIPSEKKRFLPYGYAKLIALEMSNQKKIINAQMVYNVSTGRAFDPEIWLKLWEMIENRQNLIELIKQKTMQ